MLAEMAYYRAHHDEARDWAGLKDLRRRCAAVVQERLGTALPLADVEDALLAAIRFHAYPEVPAVLARLRAAARAWPSSATGTSRCTTSSSAPGCGRWSTPS